MTEWVGPYQIYRSAHDCRVLGYPGWQEVPVMETLINKAAWESLPADLQAIEAKSRSMNEDMLANTPPAMQPLADSHRGAWRAAETVPGRCHAAPAAHL